MRSGVGLEGWWWQFFFFFGGWKGEVITMYILHWDAPPPSQKGGAFFLKHLYTCRCARIQDH